ncbi:hypothetical protein PInf_024637 [Phytophthora infestans]|nr:hypothetical protein PInf_024637 [Phytophthora infestans]
MHGFNVTVLAYGQTGSGKTYTMGGVEASTVESDNDDGLILRFLRDLFTALRTEVSVKTIKISFLEIYCDEIRDLLGERARSSSQHGGRQASGAKLTIHEDDQDVWVEGLQQVEVKSVNEALDLLRTGRQRQTVGAHALNDQSSRSHAVYTLEVSRTFNNEIKRAKLTFVDLAGSERVKKTLQEGHGMKEGSHINKVQDPSRKEEQSPLSFDTFVNRMTALYDQRSRQHQFVHRLQQRFRHLASLLAVANADNQVNELSKYTLNHQFDQLQQQLSRFERLAADRLWTRLQNREVAIENYTAVWNDQMAEVFLSDDGMSTVASSP